MALRLWGEFWTKLPAGTPSTEFGPREIPTGMLLDFVLPNKTRESKNSATVFKSDIKHKRVGDTISDNPLTLPQRAVFATNSGNHAELIPLIEEFWHVDDLLGHFIPAYLDDMCVGYYKVISELNPLPIEASS